MAVLLRLTIPLALAFLLAGCGEKKEAETTPDRNAAAPAPVRPAESTADPRPIVAAFGDSLSAGFGLNAGESFPDDLQKLIDQAGYKYHVVNMGVSGDTTTDGLERLSSVLALKPTIVIVEFGGNDGLRGQPVASTKANLAQIIEKLQAAGTTVVLAGMTLPRNYGPEYIHSFEQMYVDLANQYKISRIPFLLEGVGGVERLMQPDGIHPTAQGAEMVAQTVMKYVKPLLRKN